MYGIINYYSTIFAVILNKIKEPLEVKDGCRTTDTLFYRRRSPFRKMFHLEVNGGRTIKRRREKGHKSNPFMNTFCYLWLGRRGYTHMSPSPLGKVTVLKGKETVLTLSKRTKEHFSRPLLNTKPKRKVPQFLLLAATKSFHLQTWSEAFLLFEWRQKAFFAQKDFICISTSFYLWTILTFISYMKYLFFVFSHPKPLIAVKRFQLHEEQNYWSRSDDVWPSDTKINGLELRKRLEVVEQQTWWPKLTRNLHLSATMWLWNVARKEGRRRQPTMLPGSNETVAMSHIWARGRKFELEAIINKLCQSGYVYTINSSPGFHHHLGKRHSTTIHEYPSNKCESIWS